MHAFDRATYCHIISRASWISKSVFLTMPSPACTPYVPHMMQTMGIDGWLRCLRLRFTTGTQRHAIPSYCALVASFAQRHRENGKAELSVGARAWCKHAHRSLSLWWGKAEGSEGTKNALALEVMSRILDSPAWMNQHTLPVCQ